MTARSDGAVARAVEALGWVVLLVLLAAVMWWFGGLMANGIDNLLHNSSPLRLDWGETAGY